MTRVGWVGLGRLGGPCAAALQQFGGHTVIGYDVRGSKATYDFDGLNPIKLVDSIQDVVNESDGVVFVAVQTPHAPAYGGEVPAPIEPREFEYRYLEGAVRAIAEAAHLAQRHITLTVISTVLPGATNRHLRGVLNDYVTLVYHPFFIAMGTVVDDYTRPEMLLLGVDNPGDEAPVLELYETLHQGGVPARVLSIESAELTKVAYNTFISMKIVFANSLMELCEHTGADVDQVTESLGYATDRIISTRYLRAGMGDGGACHPRDNVALSALAQRFGTSVDLMGFLSRAREDQTRWLADLIEHWADLTRLSIIILGKAYKPNVTLVDGSPGLLLAHILVEERRRHVKHIDPLVDSRALSDLRAALERPCIYFIATDHDAFDLYEYPTGSVVIDPFGSISTRAGVTIVRPGRK